MPGHVYLPSDMGHSLSISALLPIELHISRRRIVTSSNASYCFLHPIISRLFRFDQSTHHSSCDTLGPADLAIPQHHLYRRPPLCLDRRRLGSDWTFLRAKVLARQKVENRLSMEWLAVPCPLVQCLHPNLLQVVSPSHSSVVLLVF